MCAKQRVSPSLGSHGWRKERKLAPSALRWLTVFPCLSLACQCLSHATSSWCLSSFHHQAFAQHSCFSSCDLMLIYSFVLPSATSHPSVLSLYSLRPISCSVCVGLSWDLNVPLHGLGSVWRPNIFQQGRGLLKEK